MPMDGLTPRARRLAARNSVSNVSSLEAAGIPSRYLDELAAAGVHSLAEL